MRTVEKQKQKIRLTIRATTEKECNLLANETFGCRTAYIVYSCQFIVTIMSLLTVLVHQHPSRNTIHVKSIQKILEVLVGDWVHCAGIFILNDSLCHCRNYIMVSISNFDERIYKAKP